MTNSAIDVLLKREKNKFLLANAVAHRAKEISTGSIPYIEDYNVMDPIDTSLKEFAANKVSIKMLEGPKQKPLKVIEAKARDFWTLDNLEKKEHKKAKKTKKK